MFFLIFDSILVFQSVKGGMGNPALVMITTFAGALTGIEVAVVFFLWKQMVNADSRLLAREYKNGANASAYFELVRSQLGNVVEAAASAKAVREIEKSSRESGVKALKKQLKSRGQTRSMRSRAIARAGVINQRTMDVLTSDLSDLSGILRKEIAQLQSDSSTMRTRKPSGAKTPQEKKPPQVEVKKKNRSVGAPQTECMNSNCPNKVASKRSQYCKQHPRQCRDAVAANPGLARRPDVLNRYKSKMPEAS